MEQGQNQPRGTHLHPELSEDGSGLSWHQTCKFRAKTNSMYEAMGGCIFHEPEGCKQTKPAPNRAARSLPLPATGHGQ